MWDTLHWHLAQKNSRAVTLALCLLAALGCASKKRARPVMTPCRALMLAVNAGDLTAAEQCLAEGAPIDCRIPLGARYTPLLWAVSSNDPRTAHFLVERGADVTAVDAMGHDVEYYALGHGESFEWLVELCQAAKSQQQGIQPTENAR
ncbi:MAG TPA: ankyrin repeat domain-containing protein [Candidatus Limnocylindria bacterium]|jgi:hypothetical protein|nr:ankyrin repeat domain-containing protein [Candidatus Limnocylindria bacterium]